MESIQFYLKQILALAVCSNLICSTVPPPSPTELSAPLVRLRKEIPPFARRAARTKNAETRSATLQITRELHSGRVSADTTAITDKTKVVPHLVNNNKQKPSSMNDLKQRFGAKLTGPVNTLGDRGLTFVENKGQFDERVKFRASSARGTLWLTQNGIVFDFLRTKPEEPRRQLAQPHLLSRDVGVSGMTPNPPIEKQIQRHVIYQDFVGASGDVVIETKRVQQRAYNFFSGSDQSKWQTQVRGYSEIVYHNLWKGVDLRLYEKGADLEQEFILRPGAEARQVHIAYQGIQRLGVEKDGALLIETVAGEMRESAPRIYQEIASRRVMVEGRFKLLTANSYTFDIPAYDAKYALVIDPTLLYSTFLGGSAGNDPYGTDFLRGTHETVTGIAVDSSGNAYVAGYTYSPDFPTTPGALETTNSSGGFVSKLNAAGSALAYSTYLGHVSSISAIAVDSNGTAYVTGYTSDAYYGHAFPTTPNAYWPTNSNQVCAPTDYFVTGINTTGDQLLYSSCFNSPTDPTYGQFPHGIALDSHGHIYVAGATSYPGFPTTPNAYEVPFSGMPESAFLTVFDTTSSGAASLYYSTILGVPSASNNPNGGTIATSVAVDSFGKAYLTGYTPNGFPVTPGAYQTTYSGPSCSGGVCNASTDSFVAKLDPTSSGAQSLIYSTYLGGIGSNIANAIAVDPSGNAHVTGATSSASFPTTPGAFQTATGYLGTSTAGFVSKLNAAGSNLVYSTYLFSVCALQPCPGGPVSPNAIALDSFGDAYVVGNFRALQTSYPTTPDAFQNSYSSKLSGDFQEAFLTKLKPGGSGLVYSSYLGGRGDDVATAVAIDQAGDAYVGGHTASGDFPVTLGAFQPGMDGTGDAFVTKFPLGASQTLSISFISPSSGGNVGTVTGRILGTGFHIGASVILTGPTTITATSSVGTEGRTIDVAFDLTGAPAGSYGLTVVNPGGASITLPGAFTVQQGGAPQLGVSVLLPSHLAVDHGPTVLTVQVRNTGNVDAYEVMLALYGIPNDAILKPLFNIASPATVLGGQGLDFTGVPFAPVVGQEQIPMLLLSKIPSGSAIALSFSLALTSVPPPPPLMPLPPGFGGGGSGNLRIVGVGFQFLCDNPRFGCIQGLLGAIGTIINPVLGNVISFQSCLQDVLCRRLKANTLASGSQTVTSLHEFLLQIALDCGGAVPLGDLIGDAGLMAGAVITLLNCLEPYLISGTGQANSSVSYDPNDKEGLLGATASHWVQSQPLPYAVYFSNEVTATAAAAKVLVTDLIDASIDLSSLSLSGLMVAGNVIPVPAGFSPALGHHQASTAIDLRPTQSLLINVDVSLDPTSRVLSTQFTSVDPTTGLPPSDPDLGVLPPGTEGSVIYTARPLPSVSTGTQIANQATIIFDSNAPMTTQTWVNSIDNTAPTSGVAALPAAEAAAGFVVSWSGIDVGSGIQDFTIYVSDDGGPFTVWQQNTTATSATFSGQVGHTYGFYSIARDLVGNVEAAKSAAEATTQVTSDTTPPVTVASVSPGPNPNGWNNTNVTITLNSTDNELGGTGVKQITYSSTGPQAITTTVVNGGSASFTISAEGVTTVKFFGTDNAGNVESTHTLTIQLDKTPPAVTCGASPNVLWAPNNKLVPVSLTVTVTDALSGPAGFSLVSVTSSEPDSGQGDIQGFAFGSASTSGQLRSQRLGSGTRRVYTFTYSGADQAGNTIPCVATVTVPHDQGKN